MGLPEKIKELRTSHGLTQEEFGRIAGVSNAAVSTWEAGEKEPRMGSIKKLMAYFHIPLNEIIDDGSTPLPSNVTPIDPAHFHRIPILGYISAGLPLYAEEHIEGYTYTDLNGGAEYFALKVKGDSMNALGINDGYQIIVRRQDEVENGEVAVVMVGDENATVKRFYATASTVTLMPQSTNPAHQPQLYDLTKTSVKVLGKVVKVEFSL